MSVRSATGASIEIASLDMVYQSKSGEVKAIDDMSLSIAAGEFVCVVGPSGCGKSTLMMLVAGLRDATKGSILLDGTEVSGPQTEVGIVFQRDVLLEWRTSLQNVLFQIQMRKLKVSEYEPRARELLSMIGLGGFEDKRPAELSGGMRQRVAICRALIHNPNVLLMDEPFGALDALTREQLMVELQEIWQSQKKTVMFITHSIHEAVFLADKVVVLTARPGRIAEIIPIRIPRPRSLDESAVDMAPYIARIRKLLTQ